MPESPEVGVKRITEYSDEFARQLGALMTDLTERADGGPIDESTLRYIMESADREQFAAFSAGELVGAATVNLVVEPVRTYAILSAFVARGDMQGRGVGGALWGAVTDWCRKQEVDLEFTSNSARRAAHDFYLDHGAKIRDTTVFRWSDDEN